MIGTGTAVAAGRPVGAVALRPLIELAGVEKTFRMGKVDYPALRGVDLSIAGGEMAAIVGPSGSGKSTILNMITGIDRPTAGTVTFDGQRLDEMSEEALAVWRGTNVGIIFQFFQLLPTLSALENAVLPLDFLRRGSKRERFERARHNLELVGLGDKVDRLPSELSGGEQQRVAIAALAAEPRLLVGDEPTGNLDTVTAAEMFELLGRLNRDGKTILFVTHDRELAARAPRIIEIRDGLVVPGRGAGEMLSASLRKSVTDLTRRRARTVFTVLTLAIAVASISFLRHPHADRPSDAAGSAGRSPRRRDDHHAARRAHRRAARRSCRAAERGRRRCPLERRRASARRRTACPARVIGIRDFAQRRVDVARVESGASPRDGELLADVQNANVGVYDGRRRRHAHRPRRGRTRDRSSS